MRTGTVSPSIYTSREVIERDKEKELREIKKRKKRTGEIERER